MTQLNSQTPHRRAPRRSRGPVTKRLVRQFTNLLVVGGISAAGVVPAALAGALPAQASGFSSATAETELAALVNRDRAANGLPPLVVNPTLGGIARDATQSACGGGYLRGRSQDMIDRQYFSHQVPPCGSYVWPVLNAYGVQFSAAGENIGWNNYDFGLSPSQVNTAFMNSPEHRANILGSYNQVGIGAVMAPGSWMGYSGVVMYTEIFAMAPVPANTSTAPGAVGGYSLDGYGGVHQFGTSPSVGDGSHAYWSGWDIARGLAVRADRRSGFTLDGWGGVHGFGGAPTPRTNAYWHGWDIARGVVVRPDGQTGYVLDGFGGLHGFGGASDPAASAYWSGWDIARAVALDPTDGSGRRGYVLDGFGGLHAFGGALPVADVTHAYWSGSDIARSLVVTGNGRGYTLDGSGGVHGFGGLPDPATSGYWPAADTARSLVLFGSLKGGYVVDSWGGIHAFSTSGGNPVPYQAGSAYWPGWGIVRKAG